MCHVSGTVSVFCASSDGDMTGTWHQLAQWRTVGISGGTVTDGPLARDHSALVSDSMELQFHCDLCCGEDRTRLDCAATMTDNER